MGLWGLYVMFLIFFFHSNLRTSLIVKQYEPSIDTLEDAAEHISTLYIPMYLYSGPEGYLQYYEDILGKEVHAKVTSVALMLSVELKCH